MMLTRTLSEWGMTAPPRPTMPGNWPQASEAAKRAQALSQTRGGFAAPSGPGFKSTASVLLQNQPWNEPGYQRPQDPRKKKSATVTPSPLKKLPKDYIPPEQRPEIGQAIAELQESTIGSAGRQLDEEEPMDLSSSHAVSEASRSEILSET